MQLQEWLRSFRLSSGDLGSTEVADLRTLLPSLALSPPSLLGLGAVASLTAYWLVTRPRSIRPPCDLKAQSIPVQVAFPHTRSVK